MFDRLEENIQETLSRFRKYYNRKRSYEEARPLLEGPYGPLTLEEFLTTCIEAHERDQYDVTIPEVVRPIGPLTFHEHYEERYREMQYEPVYLKTLGTSVEPNFHAHPKPTPGQKFKWRLHSLWSDFSMQFYDFHRMQRKDVHGFVLLTAQCKNLEMNAAHCILRLFKGWSEFLRKIETLISRLDDIHLVENKDSIQIQIGNKRIPFFMWQKVQNTHHHLRKFITAGFTRAAHGRLGTWADSINPTLASFQRDFHYAFDIFLHRLFIQTLYAEGKPLADWMKDIANDKALKRFDESEARAFTLRFGREAESNGMLIDIKYKGRCPSSEAKDLFVRVDWDFFTSIMLFEWYPSDDIYNRITAGMFDTPEHREKAEDFAKCIRSERSKRTRLCPDIDAYAYEQIKLRIIRESTGIVVFPLTIEALIGYAVHWGTLVKSLVPCFLKGYRPEIKTIMRHLLKHGDDWRSVYLVGRVRNELIEEGRAVQQYALKDIMPQYIATQKVLEYRERWERERYEEAALSPMETEMVDKQAAIRL